jgi:hypothetical protein
MTSASLGSTDAGATFGSNGGTLIAFGSPFNVQGAFVTVSADHSILAYWYDNGQVKCP